jgi:hypothetical protein
MTGHRAVRAAIPLVLVAVPAAAQQPEPPLPRVLYGIPSPAVVYGEPSAPPAPPQSQPPPTASLVIESGPAWLPRSAWWYPAWRVRQAPPAHAPHPRPQGDTVRQPLDTLFGGRRPGH